MIEEITPAELKESIENNKVTAIIDVREPYEYDICNIDGQLIPLASIAEQYHKIPKEGLVVLHCRSGKRSASAIDYLMREHGYTNLKNLKGGILAFAQEIDPSLTAY